jgi:caffeoyl-CoA O-methyltransferase
VDKNYQVDPEIAEYVNDLIKPIDPLLARVNERVKAAKIPMIQVYGMDGRHLEVLVRMIRPVKALEIGTLGGYSGICIARGLAPHGKLITCEVNEKNAEVARESFIQAGFSDRIEIKIGKALDTLEHLKKDGPFDFIFIDADKANYSAYLTWAEENLRSGGVLIADNTFAWGYITKEIFPNKEKEVSAHALRIFNKTLAESPKFRVTMLPTGEGLTVAVKV